MNVDIRDAGAMRALRSLEVASYLRAKAWQQQSVNSIASIWTTDRKGESFEATVPMDANQRDYALRMGEVLHTLAIAERRTQAEVYSDLLTTYADVIRIRIDDPELSDGTLPIEAHAQIAQRAKDLLLAAACSALQLRAVWPARKPAQAVEQMRRLRIGQTERGSYILTVISHVSPELHSIQNGAAFETEPPFERRVTQVLASSLAALDEVSAAAALSAQFASFDEAVSRGVNANLCDAVAGLWGEDDRNRSLEFMFTWSPSRPVDGAIPSRIRFTSDRIPIIREASRLLKERSPLDEFELEGAVVKLERPEGQLGKVTLIGPINGKPHRVSFELADQPYAIAIKAHSEQQPLHCVGTLAKEGRTYALRDVRDISIVAE
jgi:hypothetical protein